MTKPPTRAPKTTGSDEAVLPTRGALRPDRTRDGAAEDEELGEIARRAAESGDEPERPLDFEPPAERVREAADLDRSSELPRHRAGELSPEELDEVGIDVEAAKD